MERENYLNFTDAEMDKTVYRIIPFKRLIEIFASKENVLVRPRLWDDPFENFIMNARVQAGTGEKINLEFKENFFAQCWTFQSYSDAMWRIYSSDKNGIRIKTTIKKLGASLSGAVGDLSPVQCFLGKVKYLGKKRMMEFAESIYSKKISSMLFANTLLIKRPAFRHEKEIRLIHHQHSERKYKDDVFGYKFDPNMLIDEIMIDPRIKESEYLSIRDDIRDRTGFSGSIKRSLLYAPPKELKFILGTSYR